MPGFSIDFSTVNESSTLEPGFYPVVIGKVEVKEASDKQSLYVQWNLTVSEGESEGSNITLRTSLKPNVQWRLKGIMRSLGFSVDGTVNFEVDPDTNILVEPSMVGLAAVAEVYNEEYNGSMRTQVSTIYGPEDPALIQAVTAFKKKNDKPTIAVQTPAVVNGGAKPPAAKPTTGGLKLR